MAFNPLEYKLPGQFEYQGVQFGFPMQHVDIAMNDVWSADSSDVLIASYPRTGTTWMGALLPLVITKGDEEKVKEMGASMDRVPYIEIAQPGSQTAVDKMSSRKSPRLMKTHLRYEFFEKHIENDKMKVILMLRNPKDCLTSYYHHYKNIYFMGHFPGTFSDYFELVKAKKLVFGCYWDWCANRWTHAGQENILVVRYEDMVKDCIDVVLKIARFLHKDISLQTAEKIVKACSFDNMQKDVLKDPLFWIPKGKDLAGWIRKGEVGEWKNFLNEEESGLIETWCRDKLSPLGLHFEYE